MPSSYDSQQNQSDRHRFEQLREEFERQLDQSIGKQHYKTASGGGVHEQHSILHNSFHSEPGSDPLNDSRKFRKSVRFQVYNARNMETLKQIRQEMTDKLD